MADGDCGINSETRRKIQEWLDEDMTEIIKRRKQWSTPFNDATALAFMKKDLDFEESALPLPDPPDQLHYTRKYFLIPAQPRKS